MNIIAMQLLTVFLLGNPDTAGVRLPTLQLGEFVIYGIDTLHLRRTAVSPSPKGMYLPVGPRPEFQVNKLLTIKELPELHLPKRMATRNPLVGYGYLYISTVPTGSGRFTLSGPISRRLNVDLALSGLKTGGYIENAKERIAEGRLKLDYRHPQFRIGLTSLYGQNYFGYFPIDSSTSGFRRIARLKLNSVVHYSEQFPLRFSVENLSITQQIRKKYRLNNRNIDLSISGEMESGPLRAFLFNTDVIHRRSDVSNGYLPDSTDTSVTALQVSAGLRDVFGRLIFIGNGGLSISNGEPAFPIATVRATLPLNRSLATGAQLRLSREVDSLYTMSRFILPENFAIERRTSLKVFSDYEFKDIRLNLDIAIMDRKDAPIVQKFAQSSQLKNILRTIPYDFVETRVSANIQAHLNIFLLNANLQYSVYNPDSTLLPNFVGMMMAKIRITPHILSNIRVKVFDKYAYTEAKLNYNWNRMVLIGLGIRNLFDQHDGWVGKDTGGTREFFFDLNLTKEVIP